MVRRCAFDVSDFIPGVIPRRLRRYVPSATLFNSMVQTESQTFHQAVIVWKHLAHRNIIPLLGVTTDPFQLISVWTSDEDLTDYIKNHLEADRLSLVGTPSVALFGELTPSPVIRCRRRSQLPPLLLCDPWESQRSTPLSCISSRHYTDTYTAKRPRRCYGPCADHRHRSYYGLAKPGLYAKCFSGL